MKVYRIAKKDFIDDLTGEGARLFGGRWNKKGTRVVYTAESRSLATVEYLVHVPLHILPKDLCIAEIELPDVKFETVASMGLPEIGEKWIRAGKTLYLKVPSAIIKNEWNILINPGHLHSPRVKLISVEEYSFDPGLLRR